jgi:hypothetical protein
MPSSLAVRQRIECNYQADQDKVEHHGRSSRLLPAEGDLVLVASPSRTARTGGRSFSAPLPADHRSHLKDTYRKLATTRRGEAVRRARQLELI